jgi:hypothetical protein
MKEAHRLENRLDQAALEAHLAQLDRSIEIKTDQPTILLTDEELCYLEQHGILPESPLQEPLRKAS